MLVAIIIGLSVGSIYGLSSMGLVLTYRVSGVFNLAHGAMGLVGTYVFWQLWQQWDWPLVPALVIALGGVAPVVGVVAYLAAFRWVRGKPVAVTLAAAVAMVIAFQGLVSVIFGLTSRPLPSLFPFRTFAVTSDFNVTSEQLGTMAVTLAVCVALIAVLHRSAFGLRIRSVVDDRELVELSGVSAERVQVAGWVLAAVIATLSGILISPFVDLGVASLTLVVIQAMGAAVIGRLRSLPLTYLGGFAVGVPESLLTKYLPQDSVLRGLKVAVPFIILYFAAVLGARLYRIFDDVTEQSRAGLVGREVPASRFLPTVVLAVAVAVAIPFLSPFTLLLVTAGLIMSLAFQGFVLVAGLGGQVMLCQASFVGVGAILYARMVDGNVPFGIAALVAPLVAVLFGLAVAVPASRLRGLPLALLTLAFALFMDTFVFLSAAFQGGYSGISISRPDLPGVDLGNEKVLAYGVLLVALLGALVVRAVASGRLGRILVAVKNSETAAEAFGMSVRATKLFLFSVSSFMAGIAGVLVAVQLQAVSASQFGIQQSILFLVVAILAGVGNPQGAILGGLLLYLGPDLLDRAGLSDYRELAFGAFAALLLMAQRGGLADMLSRPLLRLAGALQAGALPPLPASAVIEGDNWCRRDGRDGRGATNGVGAGVVGRGARP